jgi:uncharacterized protein
MSIETGKRPATDPQAGGDAQQDDALREAAARVAAAGDSAARLARDPVNQPMINNWIEAIGDTNPIYRQAVPEAGLNEPVAPPAMIQVWTMPGLHGVRAGDDPLGAMMGILDDAGFTSVVATNCSQTYHRYLRHGEQVSVTTRMENLVGPKRTALGEGWFVTVKNTWFCGDEPVAEMLFRVLKFRPPTAGAAEPPAAEPPVAETAAAEPPSPGPALPPVVSLDTAFFWEGVEQRELRIQQCGSCQALRHPPGPRCPSCGGEQLGHVTASGTGEVHSFVVHHRPDVPGRRGPYVVALVQLDEGVRMLGELLADPATVQVGARVELTWQQLQGPLQLPAWRLAGTA